MHMRKNGMKAGMTPQDFVRYQKGRFTNHYNTANSVLPLYIDPNRPVGGFAVATALNATQTTRQTMQNLAQPQNINNNQRTEVVINGGVNVNSSASTITGTTQDAVNGLNTSMSGLQFNTGLV